MINIHKLQAELGRIHEEYAKEKVRLERLINNHPKRAESYLSYFSNDKGCMEILDKITYISPFETEGETGWGEIEQGWYFKLEGSNYKYKCCCSMESEESDPRYTIETEDEYIGYLCPEDAWIDYDNTDWDVMPEMFSKFEARDEMLACIGNMLSCQHGTL